MSSSRRPSSRMRVLLDMRPLQGPSAGRGVGSYARGLLGGLVDAGYDARLTLLLDAAFPEPALPAGRYAIQRVRRRYHGQLAAYEEAVALGADIARIAPDIYHAIDFRLPGRTPCPMVVTVHDLIPWAWRSAAMRGERLRYWPYRRLVRRAELVIAVSEATAQDALRLAGVDPDRVRVILEAADPAFAPRPGAAERIKARWRLEPGYLFFVGALDARKDPAALLRAFEVARHDRPELRLVVAGEGGRQEPRSLADAVAVGRVELGELADLYTAAGCLVFPSRYEGFGLPCVEAMACGCPVVAYRNSSLPEVVDESGVLVEDGDADALGHAAATVCASPERWRRAGLQRARSFSWARAARDTISAYESLLR